MGVGELVDVGEGAGGHGNRIGHNHGDAHLC